MVEGDNRLRTLWVETLEMTGYAAVGAADGLTASELTRVLLPDLIILDPQMPGVSGLDLLNDLRTSPWQRIPVLIVSSDRKEDRDEGVPPGLNVIGRLEIPVSLTALSATVQEALGPAGARSSPQPGER